MMESELFRAMSTDIVLMAEAEPRTAALAFAEARDGGDRGGQR